jgi:ribosome-associated protein
MRAPADQSAAQPAVRVIIEPPITLGQFVKLAGLAATGGDAKRMVGSGLVMLNGRVELRRGHGLRPGDEVEVRGQRAQAVVEPRGGTGEGLC